MIETIYPIALTIHIGTVFMLVPIILYTDVLAGLWVLGKIHTLSRTSMHRLHMLVWLGLIIMITTGAILFAPYKTYLLGQTEFLIKMTFVAALVINALFIGKHINLVTERAFSELNTPEKLPLFISGGISTFCWIGAILAALSL